MYSMLEEAKAQVSDPATFSPDQISALEDMLDAMSPVLAGPYLGRYGHWPWSVDHPWRHKLGWWLWCAGYRLMHGRALRRSQHTEARTTRRGG